MSRAVGDIGDKLFILPRRTRPQLIQDRADGLHDFEVGALVVPAHVVRLAGHALLVHEEKRPSVVVDIEPIAHIRALAVDRQWLPVKAV